MHLIRRTLFAALCAVFAASPALADTPLPTSGVYSAAADIGGNNFFLGSPFVPTISVTETPGDTASIALTDYSAQAQTTLGNNHAYAQADGFGNGAFGVNSFSGWYDQVTITGGTGTGTAQFSVQLNGTVTAGAYLGAAGFGLLTSSVHPSQLTSDTLTFNVLNAMPWALDSNHVTEIAHYDVVASPYNDPNQIAGLFAAPANPNGGIPAIPDPSYQLGGDSGMGFPEYIPDLILTPGADQIVNITLTGTLEFTYGEAFYLISALDTSIFGDGLEAFCGFSISDTPCTPTPKDGSGTTTLDFSDSAHLISIVLPEGANFSSASGAAYNVTSVPEPGEWALLLAGLGLVGWRVRSRI